MATGTSGWVRDTVTIPTGYDDGCLIQTTYQITRSWDYDHVLAALDSFTARYPYAAKPGVLRDLRNELLELAHEAVVRELARVVVGSWRDTPVPSWPLDGDAA